MCSGVCGPVSAGRIAPESELEILRACSDVSRKCSPEAISATTENPGRSWEFQAGEGNGKFAGAPWFESRADG